MVLGHRGGRKRFAINCKVFGREETTDQTEVYVAQNRLNIASRGKRAG